MLSDKKRVVTIEFTGADIKKEFDIILKIDATVRTLIEAILEIINSDEEIKTLLRFNERFVLNIDFNDLSFECYPSNAESGNINIRIKRVSPLLKLSENEEVKNCELTSLISRKEISEQIYQLKIALKDIRPPVWRRILISNHSTFQDLHLAIQDYFDWGNYHLHEFYFSCEININSRVRILGLNPNGTLPDDLDSDFCSYYDALENEVRLCDVFSKDYKTVNYLYDFGDNWDHQIKLEKVFPFKKEFRSPICVGGKRATPPEDCGGSWGYQDILEILKNKKHRNYEEIEEWVGPGFNPEKISVSFKRMTPKQIEQKFGPSLEL